MQDRNDRRIGERDVGRLGEARLDLLEVDGLQRRIQRLVERLARIATAIGGAKPGRLVEASRAAPSAATNSRPSPRPSRRGTARTRAGRRRRVDARVKNIDGGMVSIVASMPTRVEHLRDRLEHPRIVRIAAGGPVHGHLEAVRKAGFGQQFLRLLDGRTESLWRLATCRRNPRAATAPPLAHCPPSPG